MYPGKETDSVVDTRSKMYEKQKQKASSSLIPDPDSLNQHLKRARLQTMIWTQTEYQLSKSNGVWLGPRRWI